MTFSTVSTFGPHLYTSVEITRTILEVTITSVSSLYLGSFTPEPSLTFQNRSTPLGVTISLLTATTKSSNMCARRSVNIGVWTRGRWNSGWRSEII